MIRINRDSVVVTSDPELWSGDDGVEMTGDEYDKMLARLEAASMTVNNLKIKFQEIRDTLVLETNRKKIIIPEHTGGLNLRKLK